MPTIDKDRLFQLRGEDLSDSNGDKIGSIEEIYLDDETGAPEWALVSTGLFGSKSTFVPVARRQPTRTATCASRSTRRPSRTLPGSMPTARSPSDEEAELYRHYGMDYSATAPDGGTRATAATDGGDVSGPRPTTR